MEKCNKLLQMDLMTYQNEALLVPNHNKKKSKNFLKIEKIGLKFLILIFFEQKKGARMLTTAEYA